MKPFSRTKEIDSEGEWTPEESINVTFVFLIWEYLKLIPLKGWFSFWYSWYNFTPDNCSIKKVFPEPVLPTKDIVYKKKR